MWPDVKAIYIARDPRDIYASFRKKREQRGKPLSVGTFVRRMRASLSAWDAFMKRHPERGLCVLYEDLAQEPRKVTEQIAAFLEVQWQPVLLSPTQADQPWGGNSMYDEAHSGLSVTPIGRYSLSLTPSEVRAIEYRLGPLFERFAWSLDDSDRSRGRMGDWTAVVRTLLSSNSRRPA